MLFLSPRARLNKSYKSRTGCIGLLSLASGITQANESNHFENLSYSYFGLGIDTLVYREELENFLGTSIETDYSSTTPLQRSGGYTSINDDWGFSITTLSTLFSQEEEEDWNVSGYGTIQNNKMSLSRQEVNLLAHHHFRTGYHLCVCAYYSKVGFNRHHFRSGEGTDKFRAERLAPGQTFNPEQIGGSVSEEQVTIKFKAGVGYDSYFINTNEGLRFNYEASIGLPIYRRVINAIDEIEMTEMFSKGASINAAIGIGWQFSKHFSVNYRIEGIYSYYSKMEQGNLTVPDIHMYGIANFASVYWNF